MPQVSVCLILSQRIKNIKYICLYAYIFINMCICTQIFMYTCIYTYVYVCTNTCMYTYMCMYTCLLVVSHLSCLFRCFPFHLMLEQRHPLSFPLSSAYYYWMHLCSWDGTCHVFCFNYHVLFFYMLINDGSAVDHYRMCYIV